MGESIPIQLNLLDFKLDEIWEYINGNKEQL